jgi:hypothetical protein
MARARSTDRWKRDARADLVKNTQWSATMRATRLRCRRRTSAGDRARGAGSELGATLTSPLARPPFPAI